MRVVYVPTTLTFVFLGGENSSEFSLSGRRQNGSVNRKVIIISILQFRCGRLVGNISGGGRVMMTVVSSSLTTGCLFFAILTPLGTGGVPVLPPPEE